MFDRHTDRGKAQFIETKLMSHVEWSIRFYRFFTINEINNLNLVLVLFYIFIFQSGITALHIAAIIGTEDIVKILISNSCDINVPDQFDRTPTHMATIFNNLSIISYLIEHGGHIDSQMKVDFNDFTSKYWLFENLFKF